MTSIAKVIININLEIKIDRWSNNRYRRLWLSSKHRRLSDVSAASLSSICARDFIMMLSWDWFHEDLCERLLKSNNNVDRSLSQAVLKMSMKTIIRFESFITITTTWYILRRDVQSQQLVILESLIDVRFSILIDIVNIIVLLIVIIEVIRKVIMIKYIFFLFRFIDHVDSRLVKSIVESFCVLLIELLIRWLLSRIERVWVFEDNQ